jgi:hypothetical protein
MVCTVRICQKGYYIEPGDASRTVLHMKLDSRPVRHLAQPHVEIFSFPGFEEQNIVAVVQIRKLAELIKLGFGVELGVLLAMRHHRCEIIQKMAMSVGNTSGGKNQNSLLVFGRPLFGQLGATALR